jgi:hypothetical protein
MLIMPNQIVEKLWEQYGLKKWYKIKKNSILVNTVIPELGFATFDIYMHGWLWGKYT